MSQVNTGEDPVRRVALPGQAQDGLQQSVQQVNTMIFERVMVRVMEHLQSRGRLLQDKQSKKLHPEDLPQYLVVVPVL